MGEGTIEKLDVGAIFGETVAIYQRNFAKAWLLVAILMVPLQLLELVIGDSLISILTLPLDFAVAAWMYGAFVVLVSDQSGGNRRPVSGLLRAIWPRLIPLFLLSLVTGVTIVFGFLLLIVPGVILGLMWFVVFPVMVEERLGVFDSMSRSSDLTRGYRLKIVWIGLAVLLVELIFLGLGLILSGFSPALVAFIITIGRILLDPFLAIITTVLYFRLYELKGSEPYEF